MPFEEGHKKMGGRESGVRNKNTEIRNLFKEFLIDNFDDFKDTYNTLKPKDKALVFLKACEFVVPKVSAINFENSTNVSSAIDLLKEAAKYKDEK